MEVVFWFYFRIMSSPSQKAICSSRNESKMAPNEKCFFRKNWGWDQQLEVKVLFLIVKVQFLRKIWKIEDQCASIFHFADRPELPYEVDFWRNRFAQNIGFRKSWRVWTFLEGEFGCFRRDFYEFVRILAWNRDEKCCQDPN